MRLRLAALVSLAALSQPAGAADTAGAHVPVIRLGKELLGSGLSEAQQLVVRDAVRWAEVWRAVWRHSLRPEELARLPGAGRVPDLPQVDFEREVIVVVALGSRPTDGYGVSVESAEITPEGMSVWIRTTEPGWGCVTGQTQTHPIDIARLPRREGTVTFRVRAEVQDCQ